MVRLVPVTVATCLLASLSSAQTAKKPVTLESIAGPPRGMFSMMAPPVWAPQGARFVYREADQLKLYELATGEKKDLLRFSELEKQAMRPIPDERMSWQNRRVGEQRIQWSRDEKKLLLVVNGDLFLYSFDSGKAEPLLITETPEADPKLSPDAAKVAFRRDADLYSMDIATKKVTRLTTDGSETRGNGRLDWVYPEELDLGTAFWWSPDSKSIAFLQFDVSREPIYPHTDYLPVRGIYEPQRYPQAGQPNADVRVGIVAAEGGQVRWAELGETRDHLLARLNWLPDSRTVLAHRLNRVQNQLQLRIAPADGSPSRVLLEETDPAWINLPAPDNFSVLTDGRLVRLSEQTGWRHIYVVSPDGKQKQVTRGEWEVTSVECVDEKAKKVFYVSTEASPLERQLYVVDLDGGGKKRVTKEPGTHSIGMSPACDAYMDSWSNLETPSQTVLAKADGTPVTVWREADKKQMEEYDIRPSEIVKFRGSSGVDFYGRLVRPAGFDPSKKYPVIVQVYGGPGVQTVMNRWQGLSTDQVLAHKGFVVWQMDNRGSNGRGHAFETPVFHQLGKTELADQVEGVKYLASLGFVDPSRVCITGWSYGGYMTLNGVLNAPDTFQCGVAGAAVSDWRNYDTIYTERYMGLPWVNENGYKSSSPVNQAANLKGKLMIIHNIEDDNVLFGNAVQMSNALQQAGKSFDFVLYPQKSHGVMGRARTHMNAEMLKFFVENLKP